MPAAISESLRLRLWQLAQQKHPVNAIASILHLHERSVRRLLACFRQAGAVTLPRYDSCGRVRSDAFAALRQRVLFLRSEHKGWGAQRILVELRRLYPAQTLPDPATLRRWLAAAGLAPPPARPTRPVAPRSNQPHQIWQADAAEQRRLRSGQAVSWFRAVDEFTGAALFSRVFVQGRFVEVPAQQVQDALRAAFARWGRPAGLRVDNGSPWGSPHDLPTELEMWLGGLDVATHHNPPRRPQSNAKVERSQRTASDWADPSTCDSPEQLQKRLDEEDRIHREVYPLREGQSRMQVYPELQQSNRVYSKGAWEDVLWDIRGALAVLNGGMVQRKVDRSGQLSLYDHRHRVGIEYRGQKVDVRFDVGEVAWLFSQGEQEIGRAVADYLTEERIRGLNTRRRPGRSAQQTQARRTAQEGIR